MSTCPFCGSVFVPTSRHQRRWCSPQCGWLGRRAELRAKRPAKPFNYASTIPRVYPCRYCGVAVETFANSPRPVCRHCKERQCEVCTSKFVPTKSSAGRFCSYQCAGRARSMGLIAGARVAQRVLGHPISHAWMWRYRALLVKANRCNDCKVEVPRNQHRCTPCRYLHEMAKRWRPPSTAELEARRRARRRRKLIGRQKPYRDTDIFERDGYRCHLRLTGECVMPRARCNPLANRMLDDTAPTIDHIIPLCDGGDDTPENVATAHRKCNWMRAQHGTVQLRWVA